MRRRVFVSLLVGLSALATLAEQPLTNQDVVKMVSAGLGDDVVIAKVREAPQVSFHLEVDDLVALHKAGVSEKVVQAMLDRNKPPVQEPTNPLATAMGMDFVSVSLKTTEGTVALALARGDMSSAGFGPYRNLFLNYPGLHARNRSRDRQPVLLVKSSSPITGGRFFIAKLDVDTRNEVRSLKVSSAKSGFRAAFGSDRGLTAPDSDWVLPFDAVEESPGLWRVTPKAPLEPGEYGWYADFHAGPQATGIFDFGVD